MDINRTIQVTNKGMYPVLSVAQGTNTVKMNFTISDFSIPSGSSAVAYNIQPTGNIVSQICTVSGKTVSIIPPAYYFLHGKNLMQFQLSNGNNRLITFVIEVWCSPDISNPEVVEMSNPTVTQQLLSQVGVMTDRLNNLAKLPEGSTTGDAELADIRVGADGVTYETAGEAVREQVSTLKTGVDQKVNTNQGTNNIGKAMVVGEDGQLTPKDVEIPVDNTLSNEGQAADAKATGEALKGKLGEDLVSNFQVKPESELINSYTATRYSGWIKLDGLLNILCVFSRRPSSDTRVYYTDSESIIDDDDPSSNTSAYYVAQVLNNNSFVINHNAALSSKYINILMSDGNDDVTVDIYALKKSESGRMELYSKGDSVAHIEKTLELTGTYNGDVKYIECVSGESYTINFESLNGRVSVGVLVDDIYTDYDTNYPSLSDGMVVEIPQNANALRVEYWVNKLTTVKVTGKFYGDLTRPIQKLVEENFTEDILKYIRSNIGGNVSGAVFYNCQDYGVIPGSSDNTDAMQELIDLIHENGGGVIWIPVGVYTFDSANSAYDMTNNITTLLEAKSHVSILGESLSGSVLKVTGNSQQGAGLFCQNSVHSGELLEGCTYQNFTVDMSEASLTTYTHRGKAFYYSGIKDCVFRDLRLISTPSTSLGIDMLDNVIIDSIYVYEGGRQWTDGGNGGAGIGIGTGKWQNENYIIRNCVCDSCGHFGIFLEDQGIFSSAHDKNFPKGQIIANNVIRNGRNYAIGVRGGKNVLVTGNNVYENKGGIYTDYGAKNIVFSNNLIQGCTDAGFNYGDEMSVVNGANFPCENIVVTENTFFDNAIGIKKTHTPTNTQETNNIFMNNTIDTE